MRRIIDTYSASLEAIETELKVHTHMLRVAACTWVRVVTRRCTALRCVLLHADCESIFYDRGCFKIIGVARHCSSSRLRAEYNAL